MPTPLTATPITVPSHTLSASGITALAGTYPGATTYPGSDVYPGRGNDLLQATVTPNSLTATPIT